MNKPKKRLQMTGISTVAKSGDVVPPSLSDRLRGLSDLDSWAKEPAERVALSIGAAARSSENEGAGTPLAQPEEIIAPAADLTPAQAPAVETPAAESAEAAKTDVEGATLESGEKLASDSISLEDKPKAAAVPESVTVKVLGESPASTVEAASTERVQERPIEKGLAIDSVQVATMRIDARRDLRQAENAAPPYPPAPAPLEPVIEVKASEPLAAAPAASPAPSDGQLAAAALLQKAKDAMGEADFAKLLGALAGNATAEAPTTAQAVPADTGAKAAATAEDEDADDLGDDQDETSEQVKKPRRRAKKLPWAMEKDKTARDRVTFLLPKELGTRLRFLGQTTYNSHMTKEACIAIDEYVTQALKERGFDVPALPIDMDEFFA